VGITFPAGKEATLQALQAVFGAVGAGEETAWDGSAVKGKGGGRGHAQARVSVEMCLVDALESEAGIATSGREHEGHLLVWLRYPLPHLSSHAVAGVGYRVEYAVRKRERGAWVRAGSWSSGGNCGALLAIKPDASQCFQNAGAERGFCEIQATVSAQGVVVRGRAECACGACQDSAFLR